MSDLVALPTLMFPAIEPRIITEEGTLRIYDPVRKKYVALTPEEWVRQHCLQWLISRGYPMGRCSVERVLDSNGLRYDLMVVDEHNHAYLLIECKAPSVEVTTDTLRQSAWYNLTLKAPYILLTNGRVAYCAHIESDGAVEMIDDVPTYPI